MDKTSDFITQLTECWLKWVRYNNIATDQTSDIPSRAAAGRECERLVLNRYEIIQKIDNFFDGIAQ